MAQQQQQISSRTARARAAMELKLGILSALNKLGDRDTQQMAVEELHRIAETLTPDTVSVFLTCILDVGPDQKPPVRKECVRIMATLSAVHGELLPPHLARVVAFVIRRLKDNDSQIRDVCVETLGTLVARVPVPPAVSDGAAAGALNQQLAVYTKALFDAMGEQTKNVQIGAAMCLARVIETAPSLSSGCVHRLAQRMGKVLSGPGFMAKAALLSAVGSLSRVVKDTGDENLLQLVPCVQEALHSNDWTARKAAAETLSVLASPGLSKMKPSTLGVLDSYRFDKVKPVRDAVTCAIQVWKTVPGPEIDSLLKLKSSNIPAADDTPSFSRCWKEPDAEADSTPAEGFEKAESVCSDDKASNKSGRKKAPTIGDLKMNPDFFRKLESKITDDWQVEVAVPRVSPSQGEADNTSGRSRTPVESETAGTDPNCTREVSIPPCSMTIKASMEETASWLDENTLQKKREQHEQHWDGGAAVAPAICQQSINGSDWILIQRQICQLERGQTELLEMLQDFMCTCQESMLSLQDRVQRLERSVETLEKAPGRSSGGGNQRNLTSYEFLARSNRSSGVSKDSDSFAFKLSDFEERFSIQSDRSGRDDVQSDRSGRESPYGTQELRHMHYDAGNSTRRSMHGSGAHTSNVPLFGSSRQQQQVEAEDDVVEVPPVTRRAWDRGSGSSVRHGEGPSARSVWRASKDEATLEAIRGAAGEELIAIPDSDKTPEMILDTKPSWLFWTRAMENLHGGDVDSAYEEALSAEDDLLLVRMMNQTGPAFDHFSSSTAISMFRALIQILHQQHFLDAAFPWLEQVAELVRTKGAECFTFSMDAKRELVSSLHDTSALDFPERWMGNAVAKLALQLATAWSIDLLDQGD